MSSRLEALELALEQINIARGAARLALRVAGCTDKTVASVDASLHDAATMICSTMLAEAGQVFANPPAAPKLADAQAASTASPAGKGEPGKGVAHRIHAGDRVNVWEAALGAASEGTVVEATGHGAFVRLDRDGRLTAALWESIDLLGDQTAPRAA